MCVEEARGLDRFIFFSLWSQACRLPSETALQAWRTLQRLHFPFLLLFLGWGVFAEGMSIICGSAYIPWVALAQTDSGLDCSFPVSFRGKGSAPTPWFYTLHTLQFIFFYDQIWWCWPMLGNTSQYWNLHNCMRFPEGFAFQVFPKWHFFLKAELEWCFVPKLLALLVGIQYFDNLLSLNSTTLFIS